MNLNYEHVKKFKKDGFLVYKNLINFKFCEKVNNIVYEYSRKDKIPNELDLNFPFSRKHNPSIFWKFKNLFLTISLTIPSPSPFAI